MYLWSENGMPQSYRRNFHDCPGNEMSLSILEFQKLLTMHFFFTYVIYPSEIFDIFEGVEE